VVRTPRLFGAAAAAVPPSGGVAATTQPTVFTKKLQGRSAAMTTITEMSARMRSHVVLQQAACYVLKSVWDPTDPFMLSLIDNQVTAFYLLGDSCVVQMEETVSSMSSSSSTLRSQHAGTMATTRTAGLVGSTETIAKGDASSDKTCFGVDISLLSTHQQQQQQQQSLDVDSSLMSLKRLCVLCLSQGVKLALAAKDVVGVQNGIVYFWNIHITVFRNRMYTVMMPEVAAFLEMAIGALERFESVCGLSLRVIVVVVVVVVVVVCVCCVREKQQSLYVV
jgi:hypothetical protein